MTRHPAPPLADDEVRLWIVDPEAACDDTLAAAWRALLAPDERVREQRFHFDADRRTHLAARAALRSVLSRHAPAVEPADWCFSLGPHGKPAVDAAHGDAAALQFNLSHTRGCVVLALSRAGAVGVDVEPLARQVDLGVADRFFSVAETAALHALPPARQMDRFVALWTLKESYIKALGLGLAMPLDRFSFQLDDAPDRVALSLHQDVDDDAARWQVEQFDVAGGFRVALCAERGARPLRVSCLHGAPGRPDRTAGRLGLRRSSR